MKKIILIVLIIVISVLVTVVGYYVMVKKELSNLGTEKTFNYIKNQKNETDEWKIYESGYDYQLKYPKNWFQKDITYDPNDESLLAENIIMFDDKPIEHNREAHHLPTGGLIISIKPYNTFYEVIKCPEGQTLKIDSIIISGEVYNRCKVEFGKSFYTISFVKSKKIYTNPKLYSISYPAESNNTGIISQIIDTIRFTNASYGWATYKNNGYGFEFQYPKEWQKKENEDFFTNNYLYNDINKSINVLQFEIIENKNKYIQDFVDNEIKENNCKNQENPGQGDHIIKKDAEGILYVFYCSITSEIYKYAVKLNDKNEVLLLSYQDNFGSDWSEEKKTELFEKIISTLEFKKQN